MFGKMFRIRIELTKKVLMNLLDVQHILSIFFNGAIHACMQQC